MSKTDETQVDWEQASTEALVRRGSWGDVAQLLRHAQNFVEQAQCALDELDESDAAELLQPVFDELRRAANGASERAA